MQGERSFKISVSGVPIPKRRDPYYELQYQLGTKSLYLPQKYLKTEQKFHPLDESGKKVEIASCNFNNSCTATIEVNVGSEARIENYGYGYSETYTWTPQPIYRAGDCKHVEPRVKKTYREELDKLLNRHFQIDKEISDYYEKQQYVNATPFVESKDALIVLENILEFRKKVAVGKLDAEQLLDKINKHVDG